MKFKKSLLEDINSGWELEDTESGLLDVIYDLERVAYELKNCIRGSYTNCTTYKELSMYLKNKAEELDYEADALMSLDESLKGDTELSEALSIEDAKRKIDQFPHQITINAEAEDEFKDFLLSKNISFIIDDHLTADGKHGKNSTFNLKYPKYENLSEDLESEDIEEFANQIKVIGPEYRGAPYPPFKKLCINESKIPDNMRFKSWDVSVIDGGKNIFFNCLTQEDFNDYDALEFIKEVKRAINVMIDVYDFKKPFKLKIQAVCRDGGYYGRVEKVLSFNTAKD